MVTTSTQWRPVARRALLIEEVGLDAVRVAHEDVRPAARAAQRAGRDAKKVGSDVELGVSRLRKQDLVRVGDDDLVTVDQSDSAAAVGIVGRGVLQAAALRGARLVQPVQRDPAHLRLARSDMRRQQELCFAVAPGKQRAHDGGVLLVRVPNALGLGEVEPAHDADALGDVAMHGDICRLCAALTIVS